MLALHEATRMVEIAGGWRAYLHEEWAIWGPNGGFMAALALRAAGKKVPTEFAPVTLSCQFLGGALVGDAEIRVDLVKQGRRAICANITLAQNSGIVAQAQVWSAPRSEGADRMDRRPPSVARPSLLEPFDVTALPTFWSNVERRRVDYHPINRANPNGCVRPDWYRF
jgi:acyl-CoA thioesterase